MFDIKPCTHDLRFAAYISTIGVLGAGVLGMFATGAAGFVRATAPATRSQMIARTVNLGPQLPSQILIRRVSVPNLGSATMRISKIITSCGCLSVVLQPGVIPPGKAATLYLKLITHDFPGSESLCEKPFYPGANR